MGDTSPHGGVNRRGWRSDQILPRSALARDEHCQVVALQPLDLLDHPGHRGACADEAWEERLERTFVDLLDGMGRALAGAAELEALARDRREHAQPASGAFRATRRATIVHARGPS